MTNLADCIPSLTAAVAHWRPPPAALLCAFASPTDCCFLSAAGWPKPQPCQLQLPEVANALTAAIAAAAPDPQILMGGLCVLLGKAGLNKQRAAARRIKRAGQLPMCVVLLARTDGVVKWSVQTVALAALPTVH
jgi:hypothetical protein